MYETKEEMAARHRAEGRSEWEVAYFQADNQKEYEPLLKDPNTPEKIVYDMVERITLVPLKILALAHPNIKARSIKYILEKADKKKYQKELIQAYISTGKIELDTLYSIRKYYNTAGRFDMYVAELLNEGINMTADNLLAILVGTIPEKKDKYANDVIKAAINHKQMTEQNLEIYIGRNIESLMVKGQVDRELAEILVNAPGMTTKLLNMMYDASQDEIFLSQEAKDIFLF